MMPELSPYIIAVVAALVAAQAIKYIILMVQGHSFDHLRQLYLPGNMPSAHSASVVALMVVIGLLDGIESGLFGLAFLFAVIVMYDAVMVRRSVGDQGKAIQALIKTMKSGVPLPRAAKGHTPLELMAGALLGAVIGLVVFFATK